MESVMSPLEGTGPVMLNMSFTSRYTAQHLAAASRRLVARLRATPGVVTADATVDDSNGTVAVACVFMGLLARERFVLSRLYDRLPAVAGMVPGTRTARRLDLGTTDRDDLAGLVAAV